MPGIFYRDYKSFSINRGSYRTPWIRAVLNETVSCVGAKTFRRRALRSKDSQLLYRLFPFTQEEPFENSRADKMKYKVLAEAGIATPFEQ